MDWQKPIHLGEFIRPPPRPGAHHQTHYISFILAKVINNSLDSGVFPQILKTKRVVPIFKSGDRSEVGNYRSIVVLPISSKNYDRVIFNQQNQYLDAFTLLNYCQFGFHKKLSTSDAIVNNLQNIYVTLDCVHAVT